MAGEGSWAEGARYRHYWANVRAVEGLVGARQAAYWRAVARGLEWENTQLHGMVRRLLGVEGPGSEVTGQKGGESQRLPHHLTTWPRGGEVEEEDTSEEESEDETSDETSEEEEEEEDYIGSVEQFRNLGISNRNVDSVVIKKESGPTKKSTQKEGFKNRQMEEDVVNVANEDEKYSRFVAETARHRRARDGAPAARRFDGRTDELTEELVGAGLAAIATNFQETKREMAALYGEQALAVHSAETQVRGHMAELRHYLHHPDPRPPGTAEVRPVDGPPRRRGLARHAPQDQEVKIASAD